MGEIHHSLTQPQAASLLLQELLQELQYVTASVPQSLFLQHLSQEVSFWQFAEQVFDDTLVSADVQPEDRASARMIDEIISVLIKSLPEHLFTNEK